MPRQSEFQYGAYRASNISGVTTEKSIEGTTATAHFLQFCRSQGLVFLVKRFQPKLSPQYTPRAATIMACALSRPTSTVSTWPSSSMVYTAASRVVSTRPSSSGRHQRGFERSDTGWPVVRRSPGCSSTVWDVPLAGHRHIRVTRWNWSCLTCDPVCTTSPSLSSRIPFTTVFFPSSTWNSHESVKHVHLISESLEGSRRTTLTGGGGFFTRTTLMMLPETTLVSPNVVDVVSCSPSTNNFRFSVSPIDLKKVSISATLVLLSIVFSIKVSPESKRTVTSSMSGSRSKATEAGQGQFHFSGFWRLSAKAAPMLPDIRSCSDNQLLSPPFMKHPSVITSSSSVLRRKGQDDACTKSS
mmetsp:Transcript_98756/g.235385  ORF Transcript_98756/g.235385 Transcript_98756/m.235385 type:complete len:356 (+) Transcript_98756:85-1152(+)